MDMIEINPPLVAVGISAKTKKGCGEAATGTTELGSESDPTSGASPTSQFTRAHRYDSDTPRFGASRVVPPERVTSQTGCDRS